MIGRGWVGTFKQWLEFSLVAFAVLFFAMAFLFLGNVVMLQGDRQDLQSYSNDLFARAVAVAAETEKILDSDWGTEAPCSEDDLDRMRYVIFYSRMLRDVGRLEVNRLLCSAGWGALPDELQALPPSQYHIGAVRFWSKIINPAHPQVISDIAAKGDIFVATSPAAFDRFSSPPSGIGAKVVTSDGQYVFEKFGEADAINYVPAEQWRDQGSTLRFVRCDEKYALCVVSQKTDGGLFSREIVLPVVLALAGTLFGLFAGLVGVIQLRHQQSLPVRLRKMLREKSLVLHYQPLRVLSSGKLVGAEALARWPLHNGSSVSPDKFIPLAEELGLMSELTRLVVEKALAEMGARLREDPGFYISINITAADLLDHDFGKVLDASVKHHGVSPAQVVLEITERTTSDYSQLDGAMRSLSQKGFRFYMDDFGTGYSNLGSLAQLPLDAIKVDKVFVKAIGTDSPVAEMFGPISKIAQDLRVNIVAEGIETAEQSSGVLQWVPDAIGQGWLLGRPVPAAMFPAN
ncbi:putative signaling membrane protein [Methylobacillus flagellatus KT]|uniref:cyclic-guanylate-specific phosphodiesterase n=1 Tax=Methylobacillus flagellatus (strain ATCC 51484 / DSM 6875 / VKM B-1610 / KT) TaxID=265072 RepID=Q1H3Q9_METFK|nr:putative signaling membrane protein [Methylobacillus flagellatus KT]